jgi:hypothetical protein
MSLYKMLAAKMEQLYLLISKAGFCLAGDASKMVVTING